MYDNGYDGKFTRKSIRDLYEVKNKFAGIVELWTSVYC